MACGRQRAFIQGRAATFSTAQAILGTSLIAKRLIWRGGFLAQEIIREKGTKRTAIRARISVIAASLRDVRRSVSTFMAARSWEQGLRAVAPPAFGGMESRRAPEC